MLFSHRPFDVRDGRIASSGSAAAKVCRTRAPANDQCSKLKQLLPKGRPRLLGMAAAVRAKRPGASISSSAVNAANRTPLAFTLPMF